jgi:hypothetical protein
MPPTSALANKPKPHNAISRGMAAQFSRGQYRLASELAARVRSAAFVAEQKWGSVIYLPLGFLDEKSIECGKVTLAPRAVTESGEVVRIDDHLLDGMPARLFLQEMLLREIEPFIIGIGEVRVVRKNPTDDLIVLRTEEGDPGFNHGVTS